MQTDLLYKQLLSSTNELKQTIERFEKHNPPSTLYAEQLYKALMDATKLVSAYVVLKEQKDISPDLNIHLKLMDVASKAEEPVTTVVITEPIIESAKIPTPIVEEVKQPEIKAEPVKVVEPIVIKTETKSYPKFTININDKFRFINELFASNANEYNIAIEQLNAVNSKDEVLRYLNGLKPIYNWDLESEMVKKIFAISQKRFE